MPCTHRLAVLMTVLSLPIAVSSVPLSQEKTARRTIDDPDFGRLQWSGKEDCWEGRFTLDHGAFRIAFLDAPKISKKAREAALRLPDMFSDIEDAIVAELLELYNEDWRVSGDEELPVLKREEFLEAIEPDTIYVGPTGFTTMYWKDGPLDLFGGHWIEVRIETDGSISEVVLAG